MDDLRPFQSLIANQLIMKVWIDVANSPQVTFMRPFIQKLKDDEHEVIVTARDHANVVELLRSESIDFELVGGHWGRRKLAKLFGLLVRVAQLWWHLRGRKVDVGFSQSSFYSPVVCRLLGGKCVYTNDNEQALGNLVAELMAVTVIYPMVMKRRPMFGKCVRYRGVKEAIYLSQINNLSLGDTQWPDGRIYYRPGAWDAQYYKATDPALLRAFLTDLGRRAPVCVLPRDDGQRTAFMQMRITGVSVASATIPLSEVVRDACLFVGSGGSMVREVALLGVRSISLFERTNLEVDRVLERAGLLEFQSVSDRSWASTIQITQNHARPSAQEMLRWGANDFEEIYTALLNQKAGPP